MMYQLCIFSANALFWVGVLSQTGQPPGGSASKSRCGGPTRRSPHVGDLAGTQSQTGDETRRELVNGEISAPKSDAEHHEDDKAPVREPCEPIRRVYAATPARATVRGGDLPGWCSR